MLGVVAVCPVNERTFWNTGKIIRKTDIFSPGMGEDEGDKGGRFGDR